MRFQAAAAHVDRGAPSLIQSGDLNGALGEFQRALEINPGFEVAQQEIEAVEKPISATAPSGPPLPPNRC